jgi:ubiquitin-protein ligase
MTEFLDSADLLKLNSINYSIRRKRITSELMSLKNNYECVNLTFDNFYSIALIVIDNNINPHFNTVSFILPNEYPFKPPKIIINDQDYISLLKLNSSEKLKVLTSLTGLKCLCCNTMIFNSNWSPTVTCCNIISEINANFKLIEKILLKMSFDRLKLLLHDDYKNMEKIV